MHTHYQKPAQTHLSLPDPCHSDVWVTCAAGDSMEIFLSFYWWGCPWEWKGGIKSLDWSKAVPGWTTSCSPSPLIFPMLSLRCLSPLWVVAATQQLCREQHTVLVYEHVCIDVWICLWWSCICHTQWLQNTCSSCCTFHGGGEMWSTVEEIKNPTNIQSNPRK